MSALEFRPVDPSNPDAMELIGALGELVKAVWAKKPRGNLKVYVKAHQDIPYSTVYPVLEYLNKTMNVQSVDLAIAKESEEK